MCVPPDARIYPPYAPFDMLAKCAKSGCEVPPDPPLFEGVLRHCDGNYTLADMANPDFDYAGACAYVDARRFGQTWSFEGSVSEARPTKCNAAFRLTRRQITVPGLGSEEVEEGYVIGSEIPFGMVSLEAALFEEVLEVTEGPAPGTYIAGNQRSTYWFKRVPLPDGFVGPCQGTEPLLTW